MQRTTPVDIALNDYIRIDGLDVTGSVTDLEIHVKGDAQPAVLLRLNGAGRIKGDAVVYVMETPTFQVVKDFAKQIISGLDPEALEAAALEDEGWGDNQLLTVRIKQKILEALDEANEPGTTP